MRRAAFVTAARAYCRDPYRYKNLQERECIKLVVLYTPARVCGRMDNTTRTLGRCSAGLIRESKLSCIIHGSPLAPALYTPTLSVRCRRRCALAPFESKTFGILSLSWPQQRRLLEIYRVRRGHSAGALAKSREDIQCSVRKKERRARGKFGKQKD